VTPEPSSDPKLVHRRTCGCSKEKVTHSDLFTPRAFNAEEEWSAQLLNEDRPGPAAHGHPGRWKFAAPFPVFSTRGKMRYLYLCAAALLLLGCRFTYGLISVLRGCRARITPRGGGRMPQGFDRPRDAEGNVINSRPDSPKEPIVVQSVAELKDMFSRGYNVKDLDVRGNIAELLEDSDYIHPVVKALHQRKVSESKPGERVEGDVARIAIAIEGGGMRGAVGAGMITVSSQSDRYTVIQLDSQTDIQSYS
jgi:hypothetical protein